MADVDIVKVRDPLQGIGFVQDEQDVLDALAKLNMVKEALKQADRFRDESVKFARYEAYALVRAVEISGSAKLIKGKWRKAAAEWLASLSEEERESYVLLCNDGKTIDNVYKEVVALPQQREKLAEAVSTCKTVAREELRKTGMVVVPHIVRSHSAEFPKSMLKEITDGVRAAVRDAGGVGIGDENGTYIDPERESRYVSDAIATRINAVVRDIEGIADLASRCESKPEFHIKGSGKQLSFADVTYIVMAGVGCADVSFDTGNAKKAAVSLIKRIAGDVL